MYFLTKKELEEFFLKDNTKSEMESSKPKKRVYLYPDVQKKAFHRLKVMYGGNKKLADKLNIPTNTLENYRKANYQTIPKRIILEADKLLKEPKYDLKNIDKYTIRTTPKRIMLDKEFKQDLFRMVVNIAGSGEEAAKILDIPISTMDDYIRGQSNKYVAINNFNIALNEVRNFFKDKISLEDAIEKETIKSETSKNYWDKKVKETLIKKLGEQEELFLKDNNKGKKTSKSDENIYETLLRLQLGDIGYKFPGLVTVKGLEEEGSRDFSSPYKLLNQFIKENRLEKKQIDIIQDNCADTCGYRVVTYCLGSEKRCDKNQYSPRLKKLLIETFKNRRGKLASFYLPKLTEPPLSEDAKIFTVPKTGVAHKKKLNAKGTITIQKPKTEVTGLDKQLSTNKDDFGEKLGVRKLSSDDVDILKHVYWQLRSVSKLSQRRSLEVTGDAVHVSRNTADKYLFTYPHPRKLEKLREHRRDVQKNWRDEIKQDPVKLANFKKKDKEKCDRYRNKVKNDPAWKIKHVNQWRKWYNALKNDPQKHEEFQQYKSESNMNRYHKRKAWIDNVSLKLTNLDAEIITLEELCKAIAHKCKSRDYTEFTENAGLVMDLFGYSNRMEDNVLTRKGRQLFYTLEESGLLKPDRESELIPRIPNYNWSGFDWQCKFWQFNKQAILKSAIEYEKSFIFRYVPKAERKPLPDIYASDELWVRKPGLEAVV